jgi:alkylation response protein AidB-like acyl-CoA dehydrogenase
MNAPPDLFSAATRLRPVLAEHALESESKRSLAKASIEALKAERLFSMSVPKALGGLEVPLSRQLAVISELSRADAAAGWCVMITSTTGLVSGFLSKEAAEEIFGAADHFACGVYAPLGRAHPVEGGYEVSGRWPFGSFCEHAPYRAGGAMVEGEGFKLMVFRAEDTTVIDTWDVNGLRGTGSHDYSVEKAFVPATRAVVPQPNAHTPPRSIYAFPLFAFLASEVSAVSRGIARAALDEFIGLAKKKKPAGGKRALAEKSTVQRVVARCEARLGAAGAYLEQVVSQIEEGVLGGGEISLEDRARLRLAAVHLTHEASDVVSEVYKMAGGTALYNKSPFQRHLRDAFTATQHLMVAESMLEQVGRVFLGQEIPPGVI